MLDVFLRSAGPSFVNGVGALEKKGSDTLMKSGRGMVLGCGKLLGRNEIF